MKKLRRSSWLLSLVAFLFSGVSRADSYTVLTIDVPGAAGTVPHAINNLGQIVGTYTDASSEHGFLYRGGTFTIIDVPGANATQALGINDTGQVAGTYTDAGGEHGFLYLDGTFSTTDVPREIAPEAINDTGQMVGSYIDARGAVHGFLLTPVLQPGLTTGSLTPERTVATYATAGHAISARTANAGVCDVNGNGVTNVADVQLMVNEALGKSPAANDLNSDGVVNVEDIQIVINAALGLGCTPVTQTGTSAVAHLEVQSGNGQAACLCFGATLQEFQPIYVKATDAGGNPVVGATVTWSVTSGQMILTSSTSVTGAGGIASQSMNIGGFVNIAGPNPDLVSSIQASSNNNSVIFTETQSLVANGTSAIKAAYPTLKGANLANATLSASIGTTLTTPIEVMMGGYGIASDGVANISVRILNEQASPAVNCASGGGYDDPGSVLSDIHGNTTCYPTFSGSGSGTFYVLIGGVPGGTDISTALYLQEYGPYAFTSVPGPPAAVQIVSGNKQVANIGQTLNPLVARLVDANGNIVTGQTMVWSVVPAGAVGLTNESAVTDSNGEVSTTVSLDLLASAGTAITVALESNPSISATFQETIFGALTALNKISGDQQTAQAGTSFALPLVVQLVNASGPVSGFPVRYLVSGPVSLPGGTAADTDANGEASVTVTAGAQGGTATVTAVAGALTQTFSLTVTNAARPPERE